MTVFDQGFARTLADRTAPPALIQRLLQFPRDHGSHPDTAIEWWYVTGELSGAGQRFGFQLTFFRSRVPTSQTMRSAFAAKQLIFAHAAVTDVTKQRLLHDQRIARNAAVASQGAGVDLATASEADTEVTLLDWTLRHDQDSYRAHIQSKAFSFELRFTETQPLLLQGDRGWSRKGPEASQVSYYYSLPQLTVQGRLILEEEARDVSGHAWLDHEWSQSIMPPNAVGWDWIGVNLFDGSALTAFRLRDANGSPVWAGGSWRDVTAISRPQIFSPDQVVFTPLRRWTSPHTGTSYPVHWSVIAGERRYTVRAVVEPQELDSRQSTGAVYWEGLSELLDAQDRVVGRGYLEMTGYASALKLS